MTEILYVTKTSPVAGGGGGEKRAYEVTRRLQDRGNNVTILCGKTDSELVRNDEIGGCTVRHLKCVPDLLFTYPTFSFYAVRYLFGVFSFVFLSRWLSNSEFDIIIENMTPYPTLTVVLAHWFNVPIIAVQHEFYDRSCYETYDPVTATIQLGVQNVLRGFTYDCIVVPTSYVQEKLREYGVESPIVVIPNGIDYEAYWDSSIEREDHRLVTIGRLNKRKAHEDVMQAFAKLRNEFPRLQLDIVGNGPRREHLQSLAIDLGEEDSITFHGFVSDSEKIQMLNRATVFLFASRQEGFGLVLLEAMAAGTPIVARDLPVYHDFFEDGIHGYLFSGEAPMGMIEATRHLLTSPNECQQIGDAARRHASRYGWDTVAEQSAAIIDAVLCPNSRECDSRF